MKFTKTIVAAAVCSFAEAVNLENMSTLENGDSWPSWYEQWAEFVDPKNEYGLQGVLNYCAGNLEDPFCVRAEDQIERLHNWWESAIEAWNDVQNAWRDDLFYEGQFDANEKQKWFDESLSKLSHDYTKF